MPDFHFMHAHQRLLSVQADTINPCSDRAVQVVKPDFIPDIHDLCLGVDRLQRNLNQPCRLVQTHWQRALAFRLLQRIARELAPRMRAVQ